MPYAYTEDNPTELCHYGREGMRWGQHIFGDDPRWGSHSRGKKKYLTAEQAEEHRQEVLAKYADKKSRHAAKKREEAAAMVSEAATRDLKSKVKYRRALSDSELSQTVDRLTKERQLKQLAGEELAPAKFTVEKIMKKVGTDTLTGLAYGASKAVMRSAAKNYTSQISNLQSVLGKLDISTPIGKKQADAIRQQIDRLEAIGTVFATGSSYLGTKTSKKK